MTYVTEVTKSVDALRKIENELYSLAAVLARVGVVKLAEESKDYADRIEAEIVRLSALVANKTDDDIKNAAPSRSLVEVMTGGLVGGSTPKPKDDYNI